MYWLNPLHLHTSNQRTLDPLVHSTTVQLLPPGDTSKTGVAQILKKSLVSFCSSCCRLTRSSSWNPDLRSSEIKLSWEELDQVFISKQIRRCHILRRNCCLTAIPNKRVSLLLPSYLPSFYPLFPSPITKQCRARFTEDSSGPLSQQTPSSFGLHLHLLDNMGCLAADIYPCTRTSHTHRGSCVPRPTTKREICKVEAR